MKQIGQTPLAGWITEQSRADTLLQQQGSQHLDKTFLVPKLMILLKLHQLGVPGRSSSTSASKSSPVTPRMSVVSAALINLSFPGSLTAAKIYSNSVASGDWKTLAAL